MTGTKHNSSKELVGQGMANAVVPFFSGIAATGVIVRSATNVKNGAKTRLSAVVHSGLLVLVLLALAPLAQFIPMAVLAGILTFTAVHLMDFDALKHFLSDSKSDVLVFLATVTATVFLELTTAILIGFTLAGLVFIKKMSENVEIKLVPAPAPAVTISTLAPDVSGIARTYRVSGPLFFGSAYRLERISDETPRETCKVLVLDLLDVDYMDSSAVAILDGIVESRKKAGGDVYLAVTNPRVKNKILHSAAMEYLTKEDLVTSVEQGVTKAIQKFGPKSP